jgi:hypothetical protein
LDVPAGIVTEIVAVPAPPTGDGTVLPTSAVPVVGLSSRQVTLSPDRKFEIDPLIALGSVVMLARPVNVSVAGSIVMSTLGTLSAPVQAAVFVETV